MPKKLDAKFQRDKSRDTYKNDLFKLDSCMFPPLRSNEPTTARRQIWIIFRRNTAGYQRNRCEK